MIEKKIVTPGIDETLQRVLDTEPDKWNYFFESHRIKEILEKLSDQIQHQNFFTSDYSINTFLYFLKTYVGSELAENKNPDKAILKNLNKILHDCRNTTLDQNNFDKKAINIAKNFLVFFREFLKSDQRYLLEMDRIKFKAEDLKKIAIQVVKNKKDDINNFVYDYLATIRLSFDVKKFLLGYQKEDVACTGIVTLGEIIFLQQDTQLNFLIPHLFSSLAYEFELIAYYELRHNLSGRESWQRSIIGNVTGLQEYFFNHLAERKGASDVSREGLKSYFFKYFLEKADIHNSLEYVDVNWTLYSNENYTPLPFTYKCPSSKLNRVVVIEHAGIAEDKLKSACQATVCADRNFFRWLDRLGIRKNRLPARSNYTYRIFNETRYDKDLFYFVDFEPASSGFYMRASRNKTQASGAAYVKYTPDLTNWWVVSAHEYLHHLNFMAFGELPRKFDEGLAYLLILSVCGDESFQHWLTTNKRNYISLDLLSNRDFIGYNPSFLFTSYLVDTNPSIFSEILESYSISHELAEAKIIELIKQYDGNYLLWLNSLEKKCSKYKLQALGKDDQYCPPLLISDSVENNSKISNNPDKARARPPRDFQLESEHSDTTGITDIKNLTPNGMGRELIFKIFDHDLDRFEQLLRAGANYNYRDIQSGNTLLHYLYFYGRCDTRYLELLLEYGAKITVNNEGFLPYEMAGKICNATQLEAIKAVFDRFTTSATIINATTTTITNATTVKPEETGFVPWQEQKLPITIGAPILAVSSGTIAGVWKEIAQHHSERHPCLPNIIFYGLKPASLAMGSAAMNSLLAGPLASIGLEDAWLSLACYFGINYLSLLFAQLVGKTIQKIQNKPLSIFMSILLYTFFLNPSLIISLFSEGFAAMSFDTVKMPLLSMLSNGVLLKIGECAGERGARKTIKTIGKFFSQTARCFHNAPLVSSNDTNRKTYISYKYEKSRENETLKEMTVDSTQFDNQIVPIHDSQLFMV